MREQTTPARSRCDAGAMPDLRAGSAHRFHAVTRRKTLSAPWSGMLAKTPRGKSCMPARLVLGPSTNLSVSEQSGPACVGVRKIPHRAANRRPTGGHFAANSRPSRGHLADSGCPGACRAGGGAHRRPAVGLAGILRCHRDVGEAPVRRTCPLALVTPAVNACSQAHPVFAGRQSTRGCLPRNAGQCSAQRGMAWG